MASLGAVQAAGHAVLLIQAVAVVVPGGGAPVCCFLCIFFLVAFFGSVTPYTTHALG